MLFKQKCTQKLFIAFKMAYSCCVILSDKGEFKIFQISSIKLSNNIKFK